jgi:hypothetical protein
MSPKKPDNGVIKWNGPGESGAWKLSFLLIYVISITAC